MMAKNALKSASKRWRHLGLRTRASLQKRMCLEELCVETCAYTHAREKHLTQCKSINRKSISDRTKSRFLMESQPRLSAILVGDELGLLKRLELSSTGSSSNSPPVSIVNRDLLERPSPEKSVLSIRRFSPAHTALRSTSHADDGREEEHDSVGYQHPQSDQLFLLANKANQIQIYNAVDDKLFNVRNPDPQQNVAGAIPFNRNHIVVCYRDGNVRLQNIETELIEISQINSKALKVLGLSENVDQLNQSSNDVCKKIKKTKDNSKSKKQKLSYLHEHLHSKKSAGHSVVCEGSIYSPNFNTTHTTLDCFEAQDNLLAIGGRQNDLRVFDLVTQESIFSAKPPPVDWLGLRQPVWVSGISWFGPTQPNLVATCWRTEPVIRLYDTRTEGKAAMTLNLKEKNNAHPNPPAFTSMCNTRSAFNQTSLNEQLIVGTTVGRMTCIDLRLGPQTYQTSGSFKGFGGSIRDIHHVAESSKRARVISCCLDRFVRVHDFNDNGFERSKELKGKYYMKTRLMCLQPIFTCAPAEIPNDDRHTDANDDNGDQHEKSLKAID